MTTYEVVSQKDPELVEFAPEFNSAWVEEWDQAIVRREGGRIVEVLGADGGEPEDNSFDRDGAWIAPALNAAYKRGLEAPRDVSEGN